MAHPQCSEAPQGIHRSCEWEKKYSYLIKSFSAMKRVGLARARCAGDSLGEQQMILFLLVNLVSTWFLDSGY